jgi:hypothetical protein
MQIAAGGVTQVPSDDRNPRHQAIVSELVCLTERIQRA